MINLKNIRLKAKKFLFIEQKKDCFSFNNNLFVFSYYYFFNNIFNGFKFIKFIF